MRGRPRALADLGVTPLRLRWSEHEARKPYARPFMVTFVAPDGEELGSVAVSGADLLYRRQFSVAVAALAGELFLLDAVDSDADPQRAWLDVLEALMPATPPLRVTPRSTFDHERGRVFGFEVRGAGVAALVDAAALLEYQEMQAALAHQSGHLLRVPEVEAVEAHAGRQTAWAAWLAGVVARPDGDEAMAPRWPWR